jgi:hypothetical protein
LQGPRVHHISVPGEAAHTDGSEVAVRHYPDGLERALAELKLSSVAGTLVLVGAGLLGKVVCGETRRQGGIAIDVGSLFDAWAGLHTRRTMPAGLALPVS